MRVVPRVERGEAFNAGIVLMCRPRRFLGARTELDEALLVAMAPDCDPEIVRAHLAVDRGDRGRRPRRGADRRALRAGAVPLARVAVVARSSAPSEVHTGLTADPAATLEHLFRTLVRR